MVGGSGDIALDLNLNVDIPLDLNLSVDIQILDEAINYEAGHSVICLRHISNIKLLV